MELELEPLRLPSDNERPFVIAGPCSAETEEQVMKTALELRMKGCHNFRAGVWKPRTKPGGFEGNGEKALPWMKRVKEETGMLVATEVATPEHVELALKYGIDILWVGARTSANPFAVQALADSLKGVDVPVFVKNPVNPDIELWIGALERINQAGVKRLGAIHRGFSSYDKKIYRNLPMWQIPIELRRRIPELPLICDPSHIGGRRELIAPLCQQAMDLGVDGLIVESHFDPDKAWSDAKQQVTPDVLDYILSLLVIRDESAAAIRCECTAGIVLFCNRISAAERGEIRACSGYGSPEGNVRVRNDISGSIDEFHLHIGGGHAVCRENGPVTGQADAVDRSRSDQRIAGDFFSSGPADRAELSGFIRKLKQEAQRKPFAR